MKFDQDLCLNLWYELNPRVPCAFGNAFQIRHSPHGPLTLIVLQHFVIEPACVARRPEGLACKACKTCKTSMLQAIQVCYMQYKHLADSPLGNPIFVNGSFVALGVANIFGIGPITLSFPISFFWEILLQLHYGTMGFRGFSFISHSTSYRVVVNLLNSLRRKCGPCHLPSSLPPLGRDRKCKPWSRCYSLR